MDEPFSGLDPRLREKMREETLAILHETRATSIVVLPMTRRRRCAWATASL
jgi:ABC-type nitrate/sulfonate/bicarbonate transport system ATPase subunit